jgi:hypothetical protein
MGGTENFTWHRTIPENLAATNTRLSDIKRMGYHGFVENYENSVKFGLPETFSN